MKLEIISENRAVLNRDLLSIVQISLTDNKLKCFEGEITTKIKNDLQKMFEDYDNLIITGYIDDNDNFYLYCVENTKKISFMSKNEIIEAYENCYNDNVINIDYV